MNVLITGVRYRFSLAVMSSLSVHGYKVIGCDSSKWPLGRFSKYCCKYSRYSDPVESEAKFISDIIRIANEHAAKHIVPTFTETYVLAKYKTRLDDAGIAILSADYHVVHSVNDKAWVTKRAQSMGIPTPMSWYPTSFEDLETIIQQNKGGQNKFPLIIKPVSEKAGEGQSVVDSAEKLKAYFQSITTKLDWSNYIVQQYITGVPCGVVCLFDRGKPLLAHSFKVNGTLNGVHSVDRISTPIPAALDSSVMFLPNTAWHGLAELDYIYEETSGTAFLLEVNPRFWGSVQNPISAGLDIPLLYMQLLTGTYQNGTEHQLRDIRTIWLVPYTLAFVKSLLPFYGENKLSTFNPFNKNVVIDEFAWKDIVPIFIEPFLALANLLKTGKLNLDAASNKKKG